MNREWDRGKDYQDSGDWQDHRHGGGRYRDDDYYGDGKRRKYNHGAYDSSYNDSSWPQDGGYDDRSRSSAFPKKRMVPSEPSPHVIFLGLDPDFTEADLQAYLTSNGCTVETVTIIRERSTGLSKGFGFAQFPTVEHARAFVDPLFPFIQVPPPASHGASAAAAFYQALETGGSHDGRRVKIDYSQSATPHDKGRTVRTNPNDGTRDIGTTQSPLLLFRGLDPLSGPQAVYQAMIHSSGPHKKGAKGMRRIILVKDKVTMASFGFAFVEFVDVESASAVLAATMSPQLHPSGFRISDTPVAASFAHPYSFQPVTDFLSRDESCLASTPTLGATEGGWVRYWDESSTVAVLEFKVEEPAQSSTSHSKEKKDKKKVKAVDPEKVGSLAPTALPLSDKPVLLSLSKSSSKPGGAKVSAPAFSMHDGSDAEEEPHQEPNKPIAVKKVAPMISSKKTANNITKWNHVQEELAGIPNPTPPPAPVVQRPTIQQRQKSAEVSPAPESDMEFSDTTGLMCLLCSRQFKTLDQLKRHNKESELHKKNHKDANLRELAKQKLQARKNTSDQTKYRDRASERRTLFNQPDTPLPDRDAAMIGAKRKHAEVVPQVPTPPPLEPAKDENNVGNKLLKMMGWKEGMGLGSEGDGRVDPIETAVYASGAGLGASKGKDIGKYTESFGSYAHAVQESARERFNS